MGNTTAILITIGVTVPLAVLLIYFAFRNFFISIRNVKEAIDTETDRRRTRDAKRLREQEGGPASGVVAAPSLASEMPAYQQQAKKSDDAHKAQIRAHVERSVPPITPDGREAIELGLRARLAIKHVFPPRLPQRSMSYFGGLAIVPEDFDWPTLHNRRGLLERLTFLAQIDCSDLPPGPGRDLLPAKVTSISLLRCHSPSVRMRCTSSRATSRVRRPRNGSRSTCHSRKN